MNHPHDDDLLKFALELLDEDDAREIEDHVKTCRECHAKLARIREEATLLGSVQCAAAAPEFPRRRAKSRVLYVALRAAALLLIGFLAGYGTSNLTCPPPVNVIAASEKLSPPADSLTRYAFSDATDIRVPLGRK